MRDQAAEHYERHVGKSWLPRSGSRVNHRNLTSAMIDSRDFLMAKKRADQEVLLPPGPKIVVTGGLDFNDHRLRSEEHTTELQSLMRISYAGFCLKTKTN